MANIAPIVHVQGKVRAVSERRVPAAAALPERRDDDGRVTQYAREARDAYTCQDVTIDTDPGGFLVMTITPENHELIGGWLPSVGETYDFPVRGFSNWQGRPSNRYVTNGYSLAGDVYAATLASDEKRGARVAAAV